MPGGDRTGPMGEGPASGRGMGYCRGDDELDGWGAGFGRGRGGGRGFGGRGRGLGRGGGVGRGAGAGLGMGWRRGSDQPAAPDPASLERRASELKQQLAEVEQHIAQLKDETER